VLVDLEHGSEQPIGDRRAGEPLDRHTLGRELAALPPHLVAPLAAQRREPILEARAAGVRPVVLEAHAREEAGFGQRLMLVAAAEVHVHAGEPIATAQLGQGLGQLAHARRAVFAGCTQQACTAHGREGHRHQQLRVVVDAGPRGRIGPAEVEDELPLAVALHVQGAGRDQAPGFAQQQRARHPAGLGAHAAGLFEGGQPLPLEKRRLEADQGIPFAGRQLPHAATEFDFRHGPAV
jgi:hypothetical protein